MRRGRRGDEQAHCVPGRGVAPLGKTAGHRGAVASSAGKSSLMEAVLDFVPEEQRENYTAMTGRPVLHGRKISSTKSCDQ